MSIRRGFSANLLGTVLSVGLSLITVPLFLRLLGAERYGVVAIAWLLLGYFNLFDLGLGRATAQKIANLGDGPGTLELRREVFWTGLGLNTGFGLLGAAVFGPVAYVYFAHHFPLASRLQGEVLAAVPWLALAVPLSTFTGVLVGALQGRERFVEINAINVAATVVSQLVPLLVAWGIGPSLALLLPVMLATRALIIPPLLVACRRYVHGAGPRVFSRRMVRELLRFGGWVTVSAFVGPMMVILDRFVIGQTMGARWVTYYSVPFQLAERTTLLSGALLGALFPRLAGASPEEARRLSANALNALSAMLTVPILVGVLLLNIFLRLWVGPEVAAHATVPGQILLVSFWINALAYIPFGCLQATGRPNLVARCHLAELLPYFGLLYLGIHFGGITGAALAFGLRVAADFLLLSWFAGLLRVSSRPLAIPLGLLLIAVVVIPRLPVAGRNLAGAALLVSSLVWQWTALPRAVRQRIKTTLLGRFQPRLR